MALFDFWKKRDEEQNPKPPQVSETASPPPDSTSWHQTQESFWGEALCTCFGVTADEIRGAIREGNLVSVDQVTAACKAGGGCQSCHEDIKKMLFEWLEIIKRKENGAGLP